MATYTEHYNLKKPAATDYVNIEDLNGNMDVIDAALAGKADTADVSAKYTKPETGIPATDLAADVQASLGKADTAVQATEKGASNGVATLDGAGKVPAAQLPSYVDDVIEGYYYNGAFYEDTAHTTPITAETGKIYVDIESSKSYRYSGSAFYRIDEITVDATPTEGSSNPVSSGGAHTALAGKYEKPEGGIPATDLAQDVQASLNKATAPVIYNTASGSIASFSDGADNMPLKSMIVNIEPIQEGSGDPSPTNIRPITGWTGCNITRTGKNLFDKGNITTPAYIDETGKVITSSATGWGTSDFIKVTDGNYIYSGYANNGSGVYVGVYDSVKSPIRVINMPTGITKMTSVTIKSGEEYVRLSVRAIDGEINTAQFERGTIATSYEPYKGTTYHISWGTEAGTVHDGTLTINADGSGELRKHPYYANYNGETLVGPWVSSMDVYAPGTAPTIGAQVVDMGGAEVIYDLSNVPEIETLLGTNNIWSDAGNVDVTYPADTKLYIDNKLAGLQALILENIGG